MLFASLLATESLYVSFLAFFTYFWVTFIVTKDFSALVKATLLALFLTYLKPITFVLFASLLIAFLLQEPKKILLAVLFFLLGVFPWFVRNYMQTGHWTFSTLGDISMHYGRTGSLIHPSQTDAERVAVADAITRRLGKKEYIGSVPTEENEFFNFSTFDIWIKTSIQHPASFIYSQAKGFWGQLSGIGWETAKMMTENYFITVILAGIQFLFCVHFYLFVFLSGFIKNKNTWVKLLLFSGCMVFIAQNAVWADGRYRMILDPWALLITLYFWQSKSHEV
jgi:hypothetical protein